MLGIYSNLEAGEPRDRKPYSSKSGGWAWKGFLVCQFGFHRFRGWVVASQFTTAPNNSPSSWSVLSSVASRRFFNDSCTRLAVFSFFSNEGSAAFFGGDACIKRKSIIQEIEVMD